MGLRVRVAVVVALACAVVAVVVGAIGYRSTEQRLVDELDDALGQISTLVVVRSQGQLPTRVLGDVYTVRQVQADGTIVRSNFVADVPVDEGVLDDVSDARAGDALGRLRRRGGCRRRGRRDAPV